VRTRAQNNMTALNAEEVFDAMVDGAERAPGVKRRRLSPVDQKGIEAVENLKKGTLDKHGAKDLVKYFAIKLAQQHRRVIGVALSNAESGAAFDILLRGGGAF